MNIKALSKPVKIRIFGLLLALVGFLGIFTVKVIFDANMKILTEQNGYLSVQHDNFYLYFDFSLIISAVLLGLTLLSSLMYILQKDKNGRYSNFVVSSAPILCCIALIFFALFYSYLTSSKELSITAYLLSLGIAESLLFSLPFSIIKAHFKSIEEKIADEKKSSRHRKHKKK